MSEPITYSSLISFSLARHAQIYMYSDGFMTNEFELTSFNSLHGNLFHDFQNSVFRIVPTLNFKWTQKLLKDIVKDDFQRLNEQQTVKLRKGMIQSLLTNLDGEVTSNISLTSKLTGVPLIFGSSMFMLVHVTSLKFLTLNDENPEDLIFQLKDFPDEGSILKFLPCLNFQKLRTNIIYNKDAVILSSTKVVCNRPPVLFANYKGLEFKYKDTKDKKLKKQFENEIKYSKIMGSIEYSTRWRIEAYHCAHNNEKQSEFDDYLHVGDVIALHLSELKLHVNALKPYDPFKKILQYLKIENLNANTVDMNQTLNKDHLLKLTKTQMPIEKEIVSTKSDAQVLKKILIDDIIVAFQDFNYFDNINEQQKKVSDLPNSCFWKIESADQMSGGRVDWKHLYRLRHYQTGRYLQITKNGELVDMDLTKNPNQNSIFKFSQIQNSEDTELNYIKRDSFYYLLHIETGAYLGISDEVEELNPKVEQLSKDSEVLVKQAFLSKVQNHYTTFRVKKIDFSDMWETSMLQYSLPFFLEAIDYIQKLQTKQLINCATVFNEEDVKSKLYFYSIFLRLEKMLDMYSEFVNNKLISNISVKQEYSYIVKNRQHVVREQNIFILLVWMLFRCFPGKEVIEKYSNEKFENMKIDFMEEKDFMFRVRSFLQSHTLKHHPKMLTKLSDGHNKRLIYLCFKVYMTLKDFCKDNRTNQRILMKLLNIFYNHIGLGEQVVETIASSISKTKSILQSLPKTQINVPIKQQIEDQANQSDTSKTQTAQIQLDQSKNEDKSLSQAQQIRAKEKEKTINEAMKLQEALKEKEKIKERERMKNQKNENNAIQAIILKLLEFPPLSKPDIVYLLATVCQSQEEPVFVNQNLIYRAFFENKQIYNHAFMKLTYKFGDLLLQCQDNNEQTITLKFLEFFDDARIDRESQNYLKQYEYVKNELNLIANLCLSRNTLACKAFQSIFLLNKTIVLVDNDKLSEEIKAVLLKLIRVLYIDQEPYQTQKRPELVREIVYDESILTEKLLKQDKGILSMLKMNAKNYISFEEIQKHERKPLVSDETILYQTLRVKKIKQKEIDWQRISKEQAIEESEVEESEEVKKFLQSLISILMSYIVGLQNRLLLKQRKLVYNILTLEVIQILKLIFQFGFFNQQYTKPPNQHTKKSKLIIKQIEEQIKKSDIESIIRYLASLLEYDEQYSQALDNAEIQRKFIENQQKRDEKKKKNALDITNLANLGNIDINVMNLLNTNEVSKKERKVIHQDTEMEIINDPLFRKVKQLKKILSKCVNKTFNIKQEDGYSQYEVQIKIEICDIFILMLGMRQDFLIDNSIDFFKQRFVPYSVSELNDKHDFNELLPELAVQVGDDVDCVVQMKEYCEKFQTVRNFDLILDRPFYEVLILSLYFSTNPKLSNKIVELIEKYSSQRSQLVSNLTELQVVVSMETIAFYKKWSRLLNKLKRNIPNCQAWLQLDTPSKLNGRNETNFLKNKQLVKKIIDVFQENLGDSQRLKIKQRIFKHVGGFDSFLELMLSCMIMIVNNRQVFLFKEAPTSFQQYQQVLAKWILELLQNILIVMSCFGKNDIENQELIFNKVVPQLIKYRVNNFGQSKFIIDLLNDNPKLTQHVQRDKEIKFFFKLIKKHGRYNEFLDFFLIILKNAESNNTGQSNVLSMYIVNFVLDKKFAQFVNPYEQQPEVKEKSKQKSKTMFFDHDPQSNYLGQFIIMLSSCLKNYIGVSLTYQAQQKFQLSLLLDSLIKISSEELERIFDQFNQLQVKSCIFEIILIVLGRSDKVNIEIMSCSDQIQQFLQLEASFLNNKIQFSNPQLIYLFQKQSPFLLKYFKAFYRDAGAKIFQNPEQAKAERKRIQEYGKAFINAINHMSTQTIINDIPKISMIEEICKVLKLDIPRPFRRKVNSDDEQDDEDDEEDDDTVKIIPQFDPSNENTVQKGSFTTGPPLVNENSARAFIQKFKFIKARQLQDDIKDEDKSKPKPINYYWQRFVSLMSDDESVVEAIKLEKEVFANSVWNVSSIFQSEIKADQRDLILNQEDVVKNLLNYLQYWTQNGADKRSVLFIFKALKQILKMPEKQDDLEELKERQEIFNKLNATKILMQLLWSEDENDLQYLATLLSLFCMLLKKGNLVVQSTILQYSMSNQECEKMYFKLNQIISNYINSNPAELKQQGKLQTKLIIKTLQFMQLLCEGHNVGLQGYLHYQINSKTTYDLVLLIVKLQQCIKIDNKNYGIVTQCFDTITEVIQGPCKLNQIALSNSKYMEYVVDLLSENEKLFEIKKIEQEKKEEPKILGVIFNKVQQENKNLKSINQISQQKKENTIKQRTNIMDQQKPYNLTLHVAKLARLKLKALTSLVSLVECCDLQDNLILRIIRAIPTRVLTNNLSRVFSLFQQYYKDDYKIELFGRAEEIINLKEVDEKYELVIEIGFCIYNLMQIFIASKKGKDILQEDIEMREIINEFEVDKSDDTDNGIFGGLSSFVDLGLGGLKNIKQGMEDAIKSEEEKRQEKEKLEEQEKQQKKDMLKNAIRFFKKNSCSIEIVRDEKVYQVYFPKLPFCHQLPKDLKTEFHDEVNRSSAKTKLNSLMTRSEAIIKTMKHEEYLRILFNINPIFGAIASQGKLWELCLFLTTILINLVILFSYSQFLIPKEYQDNVDKVQYYRLYEPRLFWLDQLSITKQIILILGILDLVFSSLIVFFFSIKRAPLKVYHIWVGFFSTTGFMKTIIAFIGNSLKSIFVLLQDFEILYYSAYILAGIVGLAAHPFFFCVHLMEFLKLPQLKTVVQAIWKPKVELGLALMLLLILEYYFVIIAWIGLYDQYPAADSGEEYCNQFWRCFFTTFDWTFKFTGSIGAHLQDPATKNENDELALHSGDESPGYDNVNSDQVAIYYERFFFDNLFNIMLVFILLNMIQGIIIDTFSSLREALAEKNKDMEYKCFVCGFDMETLDKSSDSDKGFAFHIKYEHHMWNYVFYVAYLQFKDPTEYDGNESFVSDKMEALDLGWLPIKKAKCINDENQEDKLKLEQLDKLNQQADKIESEIQKQLEKVEKMYKQITAD